MERAYYLPLVLQRGGDPLHCLIKMNFQNSIKITTVTVTPIQNEVVISNENMLATLFY